jgi:hypothetical protein
MLILSAKTCGETKHALPAAALVFLIWTDSILVTTIDDLVRRFKVAAFACGFYPGSMRGAQWEHSGF